MLRDYYKKRRLDSNTALQNMRIVAQRFTENYLLRMRNETTSSSILQVPNSEAQLIRQTNSSSSTQYVRQNRLDYSNNSLQ